jgi:hypothetical protein
MKGFMNAFRLIIKNETTRQKADGSLRDPSIRFMKGPPEGMGAFVFDSGDELLNVPAVSTVRSNFFL